MKSMKGVSAWFAARGWILAALFVVVLLARFLTDAPLRPEWLIYVGAAILLRLWAGAHLGTHGNAARPEAPRLARTGPYRLSRNPLYVSNILAAAGLVLFANALPVAVEIALIIAVIIHHIVLVLHEERALRALHGADYADYVANTPRWYGLPRPGSGIKENEASDAGRASLSIALARQGRNVAYASACVALLWLAARWG
jgi:protein-S-isoprenylcysteine O-methyltransferase Ste14